MRAWSRYPPLVRAFLRLRPPRTGEAPEAGWRGMEGEVNTYAG